MSVGPIKRPGLSDSDKKRLLMAYDALPEFQKRSQREAACCLNISQSSLQRVLKNRDEILERSDSSRKKNRASKAPTLEKALVKWIENEKDKNSPLSGRIVKAKSAELALKMNLSEFKPTDGWFSRFKKREGLVEKKHRGETENMADTSARDQWMEKVNWPDLITRYDECQIWNAAETGIYIRALPQDTPTFKTDSDAATPDERITVLFACSRTGEKRKMLVIANSQNPQRLRGMKSLPAACEANSTALMTSQIFKRWLANWNAELRSRDERILLLLDNCSAHPQNLSLTNIEVAFFPPNTTAILQPCDQGLIRSVKAQYRRLLCQRILHQMDDSDDLSVIRRLAEKISLVDATELLIMAWDDTDNKFIRNCWRKSGWRIDNEETVEGAAFVLPMPKKRFDEYVDIDRDLDLYGELTDDDIISQVLDVSNVNEVTPSDDDVHLSASVDEEALPSAREMRIALDTLKRGLSARDFEDYSLMQRLERVLAQNMTDALTKTKVDAFFSVKQ